MVTAVRDGLHKYCDLFYYMKLILSAVKNIVFFTSDEYDLYFFFTAAIRGCFDNFERNFFSKRFGMRRSCPTYR